MRLAKLAVIGLLSASMIPNDAAARSAFFVQIGVARNEADAQAEWEKFLKAYPALMSPLEYSPRTVTPVGGGDSQIRIQAGPAKSRDDAQRICASLVSKGKDCFIVETAVFEGEISFPKYAQTESDMPPISEPMTEAVAGESAGGKKGDKHSLLASVFSPFIGDSKETKAEEKPADKPSEPTEAKADAATSTYTQPPAELASAPVAEPEPAKAAPAPEPVVEPIKAEAPPAPAPVEVANAEPAPQPKLERRAPAANPPAAAPAAEPKLADAPPPPPPAAITPPVASEPLPWLNAPKPQLAAIPAAPVEKPVEKIVPAGNESRLPSGSVDVAEAIPVPLSSSAPIPSAPEVKEVPMDRQQLVTVTRSSRPLSVRGQNDNNYWLQIRGFTSEEEASQYTGALHDHLQDRGRIRMYIARSVQKRSSTDIASVNIGPLSDRGTASIICNYTASYSPSLSCGNGAVNPTVFAREGGGYASHGYLPTGRPAPGNGSRNAVSSVTPSPRAQPVFYAQLGAFKNQAGAARRLEEIKEKHGDVLKDQKIEMRTPPRSSVGAQPTVRLRVGPYKARLEADQVCSRLSKKAVSCIVVTE